MANNRSTAAKRRWAEYHKQGGANNMDSVRISAAEAKWLRDHKKFYESIDQFGEWSIYGLIFVCGLWTLLGDFAIGILGISVFFGYVPVVVTTITLLKVVGLLSLGNLITIFSFLFLRESR